MIFVGSILKAGFSYGSMTNRQVLSKRFFLCIEVFMYFIPVSLKVGHIIS